MDGLSTTTPCLGPVSDLGLSAGAAGPDGPGLVEGHATRECCQSMIPGLEGPDAPYVVCPCGKISRPRLPTCAGDVHELLEPQARSRQASTVLRRRWTGCTNASGPRRRRAERPCQNGDGSDCLEGRAVGAHCGIRGEWRREWRGITTRVRACVCVATLFLHPRMLLLMGRTPRSTSLRPADATLSSSSGSTP